MPILRGKKAVFLLLLGTGLLAPRPLQAARILQILLPETGRPYLEIAIPENTVFILRHCHSIYDAWVEERFRVDGRGRLQLEAVRSSSPAVLEYYGLETASADWIPLSRSFDKISLLVSKRGRTSLLLDQESISLSDLLADGTRIEMRTFPAPQ
jgi:hypothetical protein